MVTPLIWQRVSGWAQVAADRLGTKRQAFAAAIDIQDMEPIAGVSFLKLDFLDVNAPQLVHDLAGRRADIVMSDMAAPVTGHRQTDHLRTMPYRRRRFALRH